MQNLKFKPLIPGYNRAECEETKNFPNQIPNLDATYRKLENYNRALSDVSAN